MAGFRLSDQFINFGFAPVLSPPIRAPNILRPERCFQKWNSLFRFFRYLPFETDNLQCVRGCVAHNAFAIHQSGDEHFDRRGSRSFARLSTGSFAHVGVVSVSMETIGSSTSELLIFPSAAIAVTRTSNLESSGAAECPREIWRRPFSNRFHRRGAHLGQFVFSIRSNGEYADHRWKHSMHAKRRPARQFGSFND